MVALSSCYLAPVDWYAMYVHSGGAKVDVNAAYTGQRHVNRCTILMPDGPQTLTIPLVASSTHGTIADLRISDHGRWRSHHWNALRTAYGKSPFFEFYADDFAPFYTEQWHSLADFNSALHKLVCRLLDIEAIDSIETIEAIETKPSLGPPYYQVFGHRQGFVPHLSILDLLFNMGPEGLLVLLASH